MARAAEHYKTPLPKGIGKFQFRSVWRKAILDALEQGPASTQELRARIGIAPDYSNVWHFLKTLEHRGTVEAVGRYPTRWALTESKP